MCESVCACVCVRVSSGGPSVESDLLISGGTEQHHSAVMLTSLTAAAADTVVIHVPVLKVKERTRGKIPRWGSS